MHLYRIAQEAVADAVRHGGARKINVHLSSNGSILEMRVDDDGTGLDPAAFAQGNGMGLRTDAVSRAGTWPTVTSRFPKGLVVAPQSAVHCESLNRTNPLWQPRRSSAEQLVSVLLVR